MLPPRTSHPVLKTITAGELNALDEQAQGSPHASSDPQHPQPLWYFLPFALSMAMPWTGAVPAALPFGWQHGVRAGSPFAQLMLLALLAPLLFFSIAQGKLATYILPCFPPFAILIGNAIVHASTGAGAIALQWLSRPQPFTRLAAHERRGR